MDLKAQKVEQKIKVTAADDKVGQASDESLPTIAYYQVVELVGKGSLTTVYKVKRNGIETIFAAKVLHSEMAANPRTAKRFVQEGEKAIGLNSPHLVSVYATAFCDDGRPVLICDFVQGESLAERLARKQTLSEPEMHALLKEFLPALALAHKHKSIHRDLKPANIVFDRSQGAEIVKLTDFGIAKVMPSVGRETKYITPEGEAFGNPTYMAPEQLQGAKLDARSDLYSLGCLIYECLAGSPPFKSSNPVRLALKQLQNDPPPFSEAGVNVSAALESVIMRMLRKDPGDRHQSVEELLKDLQVIEKGGTPKIPPIKPKPEVVVEKPVVAKTKKETTRETIIGRAARRKREEKLFVASIGFFFFSLMLFVPALLYGLINNPPRLFQAQTPVVTIYNGKGNRSSTSQFPYLRDTEGRPLAAYVGDDLPQVLSEMRYDPRLRGVIMRDMDLIGARLSHLDLAGAHITKCDFSNADLHGASFRNAIIVGATFNSTNLTDCNFSGARFYKCSFRNVITSHESCDRLLDDGEGIAFEGNVNGLLREIPIDHGKPRW